MAFAKSKAKLQFLSIRGAEYNIKTKYFLLFSRFFVTLASPKFDGTLKISDTFWLSSRFFVTLQKIW